MGTRESYEPGTFSYVELSTSDADAAKQFYGELFGWEFDDTDVGDGMTYTTCTLDGKVAAALFASDRTPPHWNSYITVKSADDTAKHAGDTGATVISEPFDVFENGRMAVIQDPQGAVFSIWEAKESIGSEVVNAPGAFTWNDLMTTDVDAAVKFYSDLFGWEAAAVTPEGRPEVEEETPEPEGDEREDDEDDDDEEDEDEERDQDEQDEDDEEPEPEPEPERVTIRVEEHLNGGIAKLPEGMGEAPPHWIVYFTVEDTDATAKQLDELGGEIVVGPMEVPAGKLAIAQDPQGAVFGIVAGEMDN